MITETDQRYMKSALLLAARGHGAVEPNPAVGCILVKAGQVIGKGYHRRFGEAHAEIEALNDCQSLGVTPDGACCYVTLEPCCHQGKTGPCTAALIQAGVTRVVIATRDPAPHCRGQGIAQLQQAGIEVEVGIMSDEARLINAPFFKQALTGQPWVLLKWAQTIDAKLAHAQPDEQRWISCKRSRSDAHKLRRQSQAILVGIGTVLADNPSLMPRPSQGKAPIRVVLDSQLRILMKSKLLRSTAKSPVWIVTSHSMAQEKPERVQAIGKKGGMVQAIVPGPEQTLLQGTLKALGKAGVQQVLVEGGPQVLASFLEQGLADEVCVYQAPLFWGQKGRAPLTEPFERLTREVELCHVTHKSFDQDVRMRGMIPTSIDPILAATI